MDNKIAFIPVGISGSAKTTLGRKNFAEHEIWGADRVRTMLAGDLMFGSGIDKAAFNVLHVVLDQIARKGGYIYLDNMNISSSSRKGAMKVLRDNGYSFVFIRMEDSFDVELCVERRKGTLIGESSIRDMHARFMEIDWSVFTQMGEVVSSEDFELNRQEPMIYKNDVVFIGDLHGQLPKFEYWCKEQGIDPVDGGNVEGWHFVFVGDLVDRGPDSVGMVELVIRWMNAGNADCVQGNHENNVYRILCGENMTSPNSQKTADEFIDAGKAGVFKTFVESLPHYMSVFVGDTQYVVSHAGTNYRPDSYPNNGWKNWLTMRGVNTGTYQNRSMVGPHVFEDDYMVSNNIVQVYGHVNRSEEETGEWQVPYIRDNTIGLESHFEDGDEFGVGWYHAKVAHHDPTSTYADERDPECNACQEPLRYDDHTHTT
jgi:protein phosphatase